MWSSALTVRARAPGRAITPAEVQAFVCTFNDLRPALVNSLCLWLGNFEDAQDAAQEAFLKCWRSRDYVPVVRNLRAWIFRVGRNSARDLHKNAFHRRCRPLTYIGEPESGTSPERTAEEREARERLRRALLDLRADERDIFLLRQNGCLTYDEIAVLRRAPVGTIKSRMRAAITKLRQALQND